MRVTASLAAALFASVLAAPAFAQQPVDPAPAIPTLADAIASQVGDWTGKLEYRDYSADSWFGLAVRVSVRDGGDGVTQIRVADFDDGPKVGIVRITTVSMIGADGTTEYSMGFRKGRVPEMSTATMRLASAQDRDHWTIVSEEQGRDDDRPARIRSTTTRDGDRLVTLKEVDFTDDAGEAWLVRNRSTLTRVAP